MSFKFLRQTGEFALVAGSDVGAFSTSSSTTAGFLTYLTKSTTAPVFLNNVANYFDGPSVTQGSSGTWLAIGNVTCIDTAGAANFDAKLWDGTTVIDSARVFGAVASASVTMSLAGILSSPAGNLRVSARDESSVSGSISSTITGNLTDSTITVIRLG